MSLPKVIEYNELISQLTPSETQQFLNKLSHTNPQLITKSLSAKFLSNKDNPENPAENASKFASKIIQSRSTQQVE